MNESQERNTRSDAGSADSDTLCSNSIFDEPWWLDAVAPGSWSEVSIEKEGQTVARWPFVVRKRFGAIFVTDAPGAKLLGPWIRPPEGKYATRLGREQQLLDELADRLPPYAILKQNFHYDRTDWLPLYWRGFRQTTRYSYRLPDLSDLDAVWAGMRENIRREIRKAGKRLAIDRDAGVETLAAQLDKTFERQGGRIGIPTGSVQRWHEAAKGRQQGRIYAAVDTEDRIHASIFVIWDARSAVYLLGGGDPELRSSGAHSLLLWTAIQDSADQTAAFDFEGSMVRPIERFFRAFGARQTPYFEITHMTSRWLELAQELRASLRR